jgi:hypothetical protein
METAYGLKEKILVASLIRDMGKAVSVERKNSAWERITTQYNRQPESTHGPAIEKIVGQYPIYKIRC